eukprot:1191412-Prorocentrum_minimum.AAC.1
MQTFQLRVDPYWVHSWFESAVVYSLDLNPGVLSASLPLLAQEDPSEAWHAGSCGHASSLHRRTLSQWYSSISKCKRASWSQRCALHTSHMLPPNRVDASPHHHCSLRLGSVPSWAPVTPADRTVAPLAPFGFRPEWGAGYTR